MERIRIGTKKIGLLINDDETLQSSDMLIYSKNILFRGNMTCLEEKKLSRVMCITNDQLPTMANTLSTVSTNCLTMAHFSPDPLNAIISNNWLGNFVRNIVDGHNPTLRAGVRSIIKGKNKSGADSMQYKIASISRSFVGWSMRDGADQIPDKNVPGSDHRELVVLEANVPPFGKSCIERYGSQDWKSHYQQV